MKQSITALVPTFNREEHIRGCLESVKWVDEILVVDSYSTDKTLEICREHTSLIYQHEYVNSAAQKNWALDRVKTDWVLQVDTDERIEPELREEILAVLPHSESVDGYRVCIKNLLWNKRVRHGSQGGLQVRIFRTDKGRWSDRAVHARVEGLSQVSDLSAGLLHYAIDDLNEELQQFVNQVLSWEFQELLKRQKKWHWWDVSLRPIALFLLAYVRNGGFRDGFPGFYLAVYKAFYSFMIYTKLYEYEVRQGLR